MARDVLAERFGVDLRFPGDFVALASDDLELTQGSEGIRAVILRALITSPGELFWRPRYGIGALELLNLPVSAGLIDELKNRIRRTLEDEPDIEEARPDVTVSAAGDQIQGTIHVRLRGGQRESVPVNLRRDALP